MNQLLSSYYHDENILEAGVDECGRGCIAGSLIVCAVILPKDYFHNQLNDSKKLTRKKREKIANELKKDVIYK